MESNNFKEYIDTGLTADLSEEELTLLKNYYNLTEGQKHIIKNMRTVLGQTVDEIARRFNITPPDVNRILHPPKHYGNWTPEQKLKHWIAGMRRSRTVANNKKIEREKQRGERNSFRANFA